MEQDRAARRLRPEDLTVPGNVEPPRVANATAVLLERAPIGRKRTTPLPSRPKFFVPSGEVTTPTLYPCVA